MIFRFKNYLLQPKNGFWISVILLFCLRGHSYFHDMYNGDEGNYAAHAMLFLKNNLPYVGFVEKKPPLIYCFYALSFWLWGQSLKMVHVMTTLWLCLGLMFTVKLASRLFNQTTAFFAGLFFAISASSFIETEILATNCEILMIVPLIISTYFIFKNNKLNDLSSVSYFSILIAGIFASLGFLLKHQAGIQLVVVIGYFFLNLFVLQKVPGTFKKKVGIFLAQSIVFTVGFMMPVTLVILFYAYRGHLNELYVWNILFNVTYIGGGPHLAEILFKGVYNSFGFFASNVMNTLLIGWLVLRVKKLHWTPHQRQFLVFCALWFVFSIIPVMMGVRFYGHYYLQFLPSLVFLSAIAGQKYLFEHPKQAKGEKTRFAWVMIGILAPILVFQLMYPIRTTLEFYDSARGYHQVIANEIAKNSLPTDSIFIWGNYSKGYYYSHRLPASRFVICEYVVPYWEKFFTQNADFNQTEMHPIEQSQMDLLMQDLQTNKPKLFIDTAPSERFVSFKAFQVNRIKELSDWLQQNYHQVATVEGVNIYSRF